MTLLTYPKSIQEIGFKYRRKLGYKKLPELYSKLLNAQTLICEFYHFKDAIKDITFDIDFSSIEDTIKIVYLGYWLDYYGVDAKEHLEKYYGKSVVEWLTTQLSQF